MGGGQFTVFSLAHAERSVYNPFLQPHDGKMLKSPFEELDVYRRAYGMALRVHEVSLGFPDIERFVLADQMRRASRGI